MSEAELSRRVIALAERAGWRVYAIRNTKRGGLLSRSGVGHPDLVLLRGPHAAVAELKSARGKLGPGQKGWLAAYAKAGVEAVIWRPKDLQDGTIASFLAGT